MKTARFPQRLPHRPHWTHRLGAILRLALGLVLLSTAGWLPVSQAAAGYGRWVDGFTLDGVNDEVKAIVADGPNAVYVGGCFTVAGDTVAHGITKWNGSTWEALGSGLGLDDGGTWAEQGCAFALAVDSQHNLYVGGSFLSAGGVPAKFIAKWSPSCGTWSALGSGMEDYVEEIATSDTTVYAAGQFANAGGVAGTARLAQWNGVTWAPVRPLGTAGPNGYVIALSSGGGSLYAGGNFTSIGGVATSYVARWDGTN